MASNAIWARYHALRDLIATAVDEVVEDNDGWPEGAKMTIAISPDLEIVVATFLPWFDGDRFAEVITEDWHIEHADSVEDADGVADLYFDLR